MGAVCLRVKQLNPRLHRAPNGKVLYHGRIDDQFGLGYQRKAPTRRDLTSKRRRRNWRRT